MLLVVNVATVSSLWGGFCSFLSSGVCNEDSVFDTPGERRVGILGAVIVKLGIGENCAGKKG